MAKRHLPPLNALRIFETAARSQSLSDAALELGLTHGAVSRQVRLLEEWLGHPLFVRNGQRSVATDHARAFASEISAAFDRIGDAAIRFGKSPHTRLIRVNAQTTFALRWLIPRLSDFHACHPDIEVSVATSNTGESGNRHHFDVLIRRNPPDHPEWRFFDKTVLFEERLTLIAAPGLLSREPIADVQDLRNHVFVAADTRVGEWERWLDAAGVESLRPRRHQRFDHYHVALQAIVDGLGVGIGGFPTLSHEIAQGRLLTPLSATTRGARFVALVPHDTDKSYPLRTFLAWLENEASRQSASSG